MKNLIRAAFCLALALVAGCSSYDKTFAAASRSDVKRTSPYEGAYAGRWTSSRNSAWGGELRCILAPLDVPWNGPALQPGEEVYRAEFHATWHGLSSTHSVLLHTKPVAQNRAGAARTFEGTSKLHTIIGAGTYRCEGKLDRKAMQACYDATYDKGTFQMTRVSVQPSR